MSPDTLWYWLSLVAIAGPAILLFWYFRRPAGRPRGRMGGPPFGNRAIWAEAEKSERLIDQGCEMAKHNSPTRDIAP